MQRHVHMIEAVTAVLLAVVAAAPLSAPAGETLYNGIELPDEWPPKLDALPQTTMPVPYLENPPEVIDIDVGRQLFVDDFLIARTTLKRKSHRPDPYQENPVLIPEKAWEFKGKYRQYTSPYAIPFSDGVWFDPAAGQFKMWYMSGLLHATCLATSDDGVNWTRPSLDVRPGTNIVDAGNRDSCVVWLDQDETDPSRRYKMFRFQKRPKRGLVIQFSADGIHWGPIVRWAGKCHDRTTVFYNPFRKVWVYSIKAAGAVTGLAKPERIRRYWEQRDLLKSPMWDDYPDPYLWANTDHKDPKARGLNRAKIYNLDAVAYESIMLGMFSMVQAKANKKVGRPKRNEILVGFSRDGFHWARPDRRPFVGVSERPGDWNWGNVQSAGGCCLIVGDRLYIYYSGRAGRGKQYQCAEPGAPKPSRDFWDGNAATGLATMRRDGFVSMDASGAGGMLTTRPLRFSGKHLFVNLDAPRGELRVEVLDRNGRPLRDYTRGECPRIQADSTRRKVTWRRAKDLSALAGKVVRFRFHLQNGRLYAFWVSPDPSGASHGYVAAGGPGFTGPTDTVGSAGD